MIPQKQIRFCLHNHSLFLHIHIIFANNCINKPINASIIPKIYVTLRPTKNNYTYEK